MEIRQLHYFVELARIGNYLNAAEELNVSQSQLSKKIMSLEEELGAQVFDRSKRKITLTPAGEIALANAHKVLQAYHHMLDEMSLQAGDEPQLRIISMTMLAPYKIPAIIAGFSAKESRIDIRILESAPSGSFQALEDGEAELGFVREEFVDVKCYELKRLVSDEVVVVTNRDHYLAKKKSVDLAELKHEEFVFPGRGTLLYTHFHKICALQGFEPHIVHESIHNDNVIAMTATGIGIALMMRKIIEYYNDQRLIIVPLNKPIFSHIALVWPKQKHLSEPARKFIQYVGMFSHPTGA